MMVFTAIPRLERYSAVPWVATMFIAEFSQSFGDGKNPGFIVVVDAQKHGPRFRDGDSGGLKRFKHGLAEFRGNAHDFAGGSHFRAQENICFPETVKWKDGFFNGNVGQLILKVVIELIELFAGHHFNGHFGNGNPRGLADKRHGARSPGIDFDHINRVEHDGKLNVDEAFYLEGAWPGPGCIP